MQCRTSNSHAYYHTFFGDLRNFVLRDTSLNVTHIPQKPCINIQERNHNRQKFERGAHAPYILPPFSDIISENNNTTTTNDAIRQKEGIGKNAFIIFSDHVE